MFDDGAVVESLQAIDARAGVEASIEAEDTIDPRLSYYGHVQGIPRRDPIQRDYKVSSGTNPGHVEAESVIDYGVQALERGVDGVRALNRCVPMEYLLVDLRVDYESLSFPCQLRENRHAAVLIWTWSAHQIHGHVRVDEDHRIFRPASISLSMVSMSAAGNRCRDASAIARSLASTVPGRLLRASRRACLTHSATVTRCLHATPFHRGLQRRSLVRWSNCSS